MKSKNYDESSPLFRAISLGIEIIFIFFEAKSTSGATPLLVAAFCVIKKCFTVKEIA